jgi:hypothetical protein
MHALEILQDSCGIYNYQINFFLLQKKKKIENLKDPILIGNIIIQRRVYLDIKKNPVVLFFKNTQIKKGSKDKMENMKILVKVPIKP